MTQIILLLAIGLFAGILSGTLGVGGGIIMVPALIFLLGFTQHKAQGTSLAVMMLPVVLPSVLLYYKEGFINIKFALIIMAAFVVGSFIGSNLAVNIPANTLKKIFGIFVIITGIKMLFSK